MNSSWRDSESCGVDILDSQIMGGKKWEELLDMCCKAESISTPRKSSRCFAKANGVRNKHKTYKLKWIGELVKGLEAVGSQDLDSK